MHDPVILANWTDQLMTAFPQLPRGVIDQALNQYSTNPMAFNAVCEEHKADPEAFQPLERSSQGVYDTTECGNDLPWGETPPENYNSDINNDASENDE